MGVQTRVVADGTVRGKHTYFIHLLYMRWEKKRGVKNYYTALAWTSANGISIYSDGGG